MVGVVLDVAAQNLGSKKSGFKGIFSSRGQGLDSRQLLAVRCRHLGRGLLVFYVISVLGSVAPFQVGVPAWYLNLCAALVNNAAVLVVGYLAICFWAYLNPAQSSDKRGTFVWPVSGLSRITAVLFAALVVVQVTAAAVVYQQSVNNSRQQLVRLDDQFASLSTELKAASSGAQLQTALRSLNNPQALANLVSGLEKKDSLEAAKTKLQQGLDRLSLSAERSANQQNRQLATSLAINSLRICVGAVVIAAISLSFARWQG